MKESQPAPEVGGDSVFSVAIEKLRHGDLQSQHFPLLRVNRLCKYFPIYSHHLFRKQVGQVKAVDNITFDLFPDEIFGLVGESGCGKTTLGLTILRALTPTSGEALFDCVNRVVDLCALPVKKLRPLRTRMQMIFQDPYSSLNPRMIVRDIVAEPLIIHRLAKGRELDDRVVEMLRKVGLKPEHRTRYPHAFSGGQRQRIAIARALIMEPALVVCDEAVSALDVSIQAQIINLLQDLQRDMGLTYIFIAHNLGVVRYLCTRVAVMYAGRIVEQAETRKIFAAARHPYTRTLLSAVPSPDPDQPMNTALVGEVVNLGQLPPGCAFHPRCQCMVPGRCDVGEPPELVEAAPGHWVACPVCAGAEPAAAASHEQKDGQP